MVVMVCGGGEAKALILPFVYWILVSQKLVQGLHVTLERFNTEVVLSCEGVQTWYDPHGHIIVDDGVKHKIKEDNLTISRVGENDLGIYRCINGENQTIELHAKPLVKPFERSHNLVQGETLELFCHVMAYPTAENSWYKDVGNGKEFISNNRTLIIKDATLEDYGVYTCMAENIHGNSSSETKIRIKAKLAPLWPFIGIVIEVVILVVIIIIYEKKKSKRDAEEILKDNGQKTGENNAASLRQRK